MFDTEQLFEDLLDSNESFFWHDGWISATYLGKLRGTFANN
jgi:hypothetical protein